MYPKSMPGMIANSKLEISMPSTHIIIELQLRDTITTSGTQFQSTSNPNEQIATGGNNRSTLQFSGCSSDDCFMYGYGNLATCELPHHDDLRQQLGRVWSRQP